VTADARSVRRLPPRQAKLTVVREPCSRARSLLRHWHTFFGKAHPIQAVRTLPQLAAFLRREWRNVTATPWPEADAARHHYIVGWPQAWYVDACTTVICFDAVNRELPRYCKAAQAGRPPPQPLPPPATRRASAAAAASADARACDAIRELYADDTAIYNRHCPVS
jgi:hypothetical protein